MPVGRCARITKYSIKLKKLSKKYKSRILKTSTISLSLSKKTSTISTDRLKIGRFKIALPMIRRIEYKRE
jgi:hypothetical protein